MKHVVITGSECTGKTTLAESLAGHYETVWVPEYVRLFVKEKGAPPEADDVDDIARGQLELENAVARDASRVLILDTDLLSTIVYGRHYYGSCPEWIEETLAHRRADLYLLAGIDVPWTPDGSQRDRGHMREEMQALFREALEERGLPFFEIVGSPEQRTVNATRAIDGILGLS